MLAALAPPELRVRERGAARVEDRRRAGRPMHPAAHQLAGPVPATRRQVGVLSGQEVERLAEVGPYRRHDRPVRIGQQRFEHGDGVIGQLPCGVSLVQILGVPDQKTAGLVARPASGLVGQNQFEFRRQPSRVRLIHRHQG
ncbi:hypothetical protein ACFZCP_28695 [Streptomyces sp. NPDC007971]|uniref:hypothetical protein n=1 Tax=Streptomyces sp. NPDC007971 TaxID=3364799 RepID=UPI0036EFFEF3